MGSRFFGAELAERMKVEFAAASGDFMQRISA
jgi:hypothetical protein